MDSKNNLNNSEGEDSSKSNQNSKSESDSSQDASGIKSTHKRPVTNDSPSSDEDDSSSTPKIRRVGSSIRETPSARRSLVEEQNKAYEKSLATDQEKERIKAENERIKNEKIKEEETRNKKIPQQKLNARKLLPDEPGDKEEGIFTFVIRFPSNTTIRRNFRPTDTIHTLYNAVFSHDEAPMLFKLFRYPNESIPINRILMTIQEYGFQRKEVLHVQEQ